MHRDAPDYDEQAEELDTRGYDPVHLRKVHTEYDASWESKRLVYEQHLPGRLIATEEPPILSKTAEDRIAELLSRDASRTP